MPFVRVDKIESPDNGIVFIGKIKLEVKDVWATIPSRSIGRTKTIRI
jgi:hypothetical protein